MPIVRVESSSNGGGGDGGVVEDVSMESTGGGVEVVLDFAGIREELRKVGTKMGTKKRQSERREPPGERTIAGVNASSLLRSSAGRDGLTG